MGCASSVQTQPVLVYRVGETLDKPDAIEVPKCSEPMTKVPTPTQDTAKIFHFERVQDAVEYTPVITQQEEHIPAIPIPVMESVSPIGNRYISVLSNSVLAIPSKSPKRVNLIDILKERSTLSNTTTTKATEGEVPARKQDLIQLIKAKRILSSSTEGLRSYMDSSRHRRSFLMRELSMEIKEEPQEQSSLSNVLQDPPATHPKSISGLSTFSKQLSEEERPVLSNNGSFMVDDLQRLNFDKYSVRVETMQVSFEQFQSRSNRSNRSWIEVEQSIEDPNPQTKPQVLKQNPLRKTNSQNVYLSPRDNYLNPYSKPYKANTPRPRMNSTHSNRPVLETDKMMKSFDDQGNKKINDYVVMSNIGRGGFGKVKKVFTTQSREIFAMKVANKEKLRKKMLSRTKSAFTFLEQEVAIMKKMDHLNIVKLHEVIDDPDNDKLYLIMDFIEHGPVNSKTYWEHTDKSQLDETGSVIGKPVILEDRLKKYFRDFLCGIHYIHNVANVVHRDIKPDNLLIDKQDNLHIADFGVSQIIDQSEEIAGSAGTKAFLPPEAYEAKNYNGKAADIWAAGVCFYFLATGQLPFKPTKLDELKQAILYGTPDYPPSLNPQMCDLLQQCLQKQQSQRITLEALMQHPWVTDNGRTQLLNVDDELQHLFISDNDIKSAFTGLTLRAKVRITAKLREKLDQSRARLKTKNSFVN